MASAEDDHRCEGTPKRQRAEPDRRIVVVIVPPMCIRPTMGYMVRTNHQGTDNPPPQIIAEYGATNVAHYQLCKDSGIADPCTSSDPVVMELLESAEKPMTSIMIWDTVVDPSAEKFFRKTWRHKHHDMDWEFETIDNIALMRKELRAYNRRRARAGIAGGPVPLPRFTLWYYDEDDDKPMPVIASKAYILVVDGASEADLDYVRNDPGFAALVAHEVICDEIGLDTCHPPTLRASSKPQLMAFDYDDSALELFLAAMSKPRPGFCVVTVDRLTLFHTCKQYAAIRAQTYRIVQRPPQTTVTPLGTE